MARVHRQNWVSSSQSLVEWKVHLGKRDEVSEGIDRTKTEQSDWQEEYDEAWRRPKTAKRDGDWDQVLQ